MDFALSAEQEAIREGVLRLCARFEADYWRAPHDETGDFPEEFVAAMTEAGWLGRHHADRARRLGPGSHRGGDRHAGGGREAGGVLRRQRASPEHLRPIPVVMFGTADRSREGHPR